MFIPMPRLGAQARFRPTLTHLTHARPSPTSLAAQASTPGSDSSPCVPSTTSTPCTPSTGSNNGTSLLKRRKIDHADDTASSTKKRRLSPVSSAADSSATVEKELKALKGSNKRSRNTRKRKTGEATADLPRKTKKPRPIPVGPIPVGFANDRNLCYLNSIVQILLAQPAFVDAILAANTANVTENKTADAAVTTELARLIAERTRLQAKPTIARGDFLSLHALKTALATHSALYNNDEQQDAQEAFEQIIEAIGKETDSSTLAFACPFTHTIQETIRCAGCGHVTIIEEEHVSATMNLRGDPTSASSNKTDSDPSIQDILDGTRETIERDCHCCKAKLATHERTRRIEELPSILAVHIPRVDDFLRKIDDKVALDETPECVLTGIVHHRGTGARGHYYASVRNADDGTWTMADDARVRRMTHKEAFQRSSTSSMLFYAVDS